MMILMNIVASCVTFSTRCSEKIPSTAHQLFGDVALLRLLLAKLFACCFKLDAISAGDFFFRSDYVTAVANRLLP